MEIYVKYLAFKFQLPPLIAGAPLPKCEVCDTAKLCPAPAWSLLGWGVQPAVRHPAYLRIYGAAHLHIYVSTYLHIYVSIAAPGTRHYCAEEYLCCRRSAGWWGWEVDISR